MKQLGHSVTGSDLKPGKAAAMLESAGIDVMEGHSPGNIPVAPRLLVVRSSAVREDNCEFRKALQAGRECLLRGEMLARLAGCYPKAVAVAGSHGKTSVCSMLVHILKACGSSPGYMIGGRVRGWERSADAGDGALFVAESDESDGTQTLLKCDILLLNNVDDDHSWSVGGQDQLFANFAKLCANSARVLYTRCAFLDEFLSGHPSRKAVEANTFLSSHLSGFQLENASIAAECAIALGVPEERALDAVLSFPGVERRMTIRHAERDLMVVEDYAHHPTELRASIAALRALKPGWHLRVVFQPHRQARLEKYLSSFACELRNADDVVVVPVFSAWSGTGPTGSERLAAETGGARYIEGPWVDSAAYLASSIQRPEILAIVGAGDIEEILPELIALLKRNSISGIL